MLNDIKMKKIYSGIRSQSPFENLRRPPKITPTLAFKSTSPKSYIWLKFRMEYKWGLGVE